MAAVIFNIAFTSVIVLPLSFTLSMLILNLIFNAVYPEEIYAIEMFGILWGVLSTLLILFVPKILYVKEYINNPRSSKLSITNKPTFGTGSRASATAPNKHRKGSSKFASQANSNSSFLGSFTNRSRSDSHSHISRESVPEISDKDMNELYVHLESVKSEIEVLKLTKTNVEATYRTFLDENQDLKRRFKMN